MPSWGQNGGYMGQTLSIRIVFTYVRFFTNVMLHSTEYHFFTGLHEKANPNYSALMTLFSVILQVLGSFRRFVMS